MKKSTWTILIVVLIGAVLVGGLAFAATRFMGVGFTHFGAFRGARLAGRATFPMMGFPMGFMMLWGLGRLALWGLVIGGIIALIVGASRNRTAPVAPPAPETPLDILKRRYAAGEINKEQYDEMKRTLSES